MSEELDDPRVLKRLAKRLGWSTIAGLAAALAGAAFAAAIYFPIVGSLKLVFFTGFGAFLWLELGALIFGLIGFTWTWKRLAPRRVGKRSE
jgi:ABC-type sugar transport system substrate-binding protein